jgi:hypothetical protein
MKFLETYPAPIMANLQGLAKELADRLRPDSLLLLGSAARGELSWRLTNGTLEFFSDLEFLAVSASAPTSVQRRIVSDIAASWERRIANPNPLFHIDIITRKRSRLQTLPPIIFTYELKQNGRVLSGKDVREEVRAVSLDNLDFRNTNEILYKRLWAILLHLPKRFVLGKMSEGERVVAGYVLCRNALDITTVLLPHEGVLLPTYQQRVEYIAGNFGRLKLLQDFGADFPVFLRSCLQRRKDLDFASADISQLYHQTIGHLSRSLQVLLPDSATLPGIAQCSHEFFNEWPISRGEWYNLARMTAQQVRRQGPGQAIRWLNLPKKGWLTTGLWFAHKALVAWQLGNQVEAEDAMSESCNALTRLAGFNVDLQGDFPERWLRLRQDWGEFWRQYIRFGSGAYSHRFHMIMEWQRD